MKKFILKIDKILIKFPPIKKNLKIDKKFKNKKNFSIKTTIIYWAKKGTVNLKKYGPSREI
jgi:hypothetical protein